MTELGPAARALLDAARGGLGPDAAALARVRAKVDASIATGAAGAGVGAAVVAKLSLVAIVAALATGAIVHQARDPIATTPQLALAVSTAEPAMATPIAIRVHEPAPAEVRAPPAVRAAIVAPVRRPDPQPAPRAVAPPAVARIDLAREVELVDDAMAALRRNYLAVALAAVRTHRIETAGRGQLAEDAAAIEIEALCRLHDPDVVSKLEAFDARWPDSAQRSRLSTKCP